MTAIVIMIAIAFIVGIISIRFLYMYVKREDRLLSVLMTIFIAVFVVVWVQYFEMYWNMI